ncbi:restriction endonuclease subunit S [Pseudoalteromonas espejiana]
MIGTIGNPVVVNKKQDFSIKNVGLFKKNETTINSAYLKYWLDNSLFSSWLKPKLRGSTQKFAPLGLLREIPIPLPPFNEQIRIVEKIEELFSELDKGIENLKTAKAQLSVYRQALLKHAFEGKLTEQWRASNADKLESPETTPYSHSTRARSSLPTAT